MGPDLDQVFVGSEGTLGIITGARLRARTRPRSPIGGLRTVGRPSTTASRRVVGSSVAAAPLRCSACTTRVEGERNFGTGDVHPLLVLDEGDPGLVDATLAIVAEECAAASVLDAGLLDTWLAHRNDVSALERADPARVRGRHDGDHGAVERCRARVRTRDRGDHAQWSTRSPRRPTSRTPTPTVRASTSRSRAPHPEQRESYYRAAWDAGTRAVLAEGGALSHHHGVGLNRARFVREALGDELRRARGDEARARPERHPQPRQARPPRPLGRRRHHLVVGRLHT